MTSPRFALYDLRPTTFGSAGGPRLVFPHQFASVSGSTASPARNFSRIQQRGCLGRRGISARSSHLVAQRGDGGKRSPAEQQPAPMRCVKIETMRRNRAADGHEENRGPGQDSLRTQQPAALVAGGVAAIHIRGLIVKMT